MKPFSPSGARLRARVVVLAALVAVSVITFRVRSACADAPAPSAAVSASPSAAASASAPKRATSAAAVVDPASPRASVAHYLDLCRAGSYAQAARYLDLEGVPSADGPRLARELKEVLDRHVWLDLEKISASPAGDPSDGLAPDVDEIARIPGPSGEKAPVRIARRGDRWVFDRATVGHIDAWYDALENRWLYEHLPPALLLPGPREILWWQWIALPILALASVLLGRMVGGLARRILTRVASLSRSSWDDAIVMRLSGPLRAASALVVSYIAVSFLGLYSPAEQLIDDILRAAALVVFFWAMVRLVDVARDVVSVSSWAREHAASRSLVPLGARVGKVGVFAMGVIAVVSELGYPVASLIAGLGIGGLALALAAQKTVENLFGAFSIGIDQPFREGDFVKVEDFVGTVEAIGLRSTRIRTLDRTIISVPNGKLADTRLESFAPRDRIRLACTIGLVYETRGDQTREVLAGFERVLREQPKIWPDAVVVRFVGFGESSLNVDVMAWFETSDWNDFQTIRQDVFLQFMDVVEAAGSGFAFPSRMLYLANAETPRIVGGRAESSRSGSTRAAPIS